MSHTSGQSTRDSRGRRARGSRAGAAEGTHVALSECAEERHERVKLTALDVDPEDVDELLI